MRVVLAFAALLALAACERVADAEMSGAEGVEGVVNVAEAWARPADTSGVNRSAAYFMLRNGTAEPVGLVGVRTDVARVAELHQSFQEDGVMRMRPTVDGVEIAPDEAVVFEPGGYHVMLIDLQRPLVAGDRFPMTLTLEPGGAREVEVEVRGP